MNTQNFREIRNEIYCIKTTHRTFLVECLSEDALLDCVAKYAAKGYIISSVTQILANDMGRHPRVKALSSPAYKEKLMRELHRTKYGPFEPGDTLYSNRFCHITLEAVFDDEEAMRAAGYTEPTYTEIDGWDVCGKSIELNRMTFAAAPKK